MTSHTFIKIKRPTKPAPQLQDSSQIDEQLKVAPAQPLKIDEQPEQPALKLPKAAIPAEVEPTQSLELEPPEQLEIIVESELVVEVPPEESVFGCGWSVTELRNEFSGRQ